MSECRNYSNGKLVSWSQRRCIECLRFLGKYEHKHCSKCRNKMELRWQKEHPERRWYLRHREEDRKRAREYYHRTHPEAIYQ